MATPFDQMLSTVPAALAARTLSAMLSPAPQGDATGEGADIISALAAQPPVASTQGSTAFATGLPTQPAVTMEQALAGLPTQSATVAMPPAPAAQNPYQIAPVVQAPQQDRGMGPFVPVRYSTDGGRSTMEGGYGNGSLLTQFALARRFGMTPEQFDQQRAGVNVRQARRGGAWEQMYNDTLAQTGDPDLARSNADFQSALTTPGLSPDFAVAGQDDALRRAFAAQDRVNAASMIDPNASSVNVGRFVPGTHAVGATTDGRPIVQTSPVGEQTVLPMGGNVLPSVSVANQGAAALGDRMRKTVDAQAGRQAVQQQLRLQSQMQIQQMRQDAAAENARNRNLVSAVNGYLRNNMPVPPALQAEYDRLLLGGAGGESAGSSIQY